ncbi:MAG TPA: calcium/sodium antiporter [Xanthomonadales bacterium]|nr:calcium/sodium antiporter [Xanthomonadales bacterium]
MYPALFFILGLLLLLIGSQGVIRNALIISTLTRIPAFVIGVTIVAIGTSLPEMVVSFFGGLEESPDLALGNIIGSNTANIGLILGISLLLKPIYIGKTKTQKNMLISLVVSLYLFTTLLIGGLSQLHGLVFVVLGVVVIWWQIIQGKKDGIIEAPVIKQMINPVLAFSFFSASLVALFIGGKLLVDGGISIATLFKIPPAIIGATAVAIGTSIPELAVSVSALLGKTSRDEEKLVIGNILGSNIFNILFGAGMLGLFGVKNFTNLVSLYAFLIFSVFFFFLLLIFKGNKIPRYFGFVFLAVYITYFVFLFK